MRLTARRTIRRSAASCTRRSKAVRCRAARHAPLRQGDRRRRMETAAYAVTSSASAVWARMSWISGETDADFEIPCAWQALLLFSTRTGTSQSASARPPPPGAPGQFPRPLPGNAPPACANPGPPSVARPAWLGGPAGGSADGTYAAGQPRGRRLDRRIPLRAHSARPGGQASAQPHCQMQAARRGWRDSAGLRNSPGLTRPAQAPIFETHASQPGSTERNARDRRRRPADCR